MSNRAYIGMIGLAIFTLVVLSGQTMPAKPLPAAVEKATATYGTALRQLRQDYAQRVAEDNKKYVESLELALKDATTSGDAVTVSRIKTLRDEARDDLVVDQGPPRIIGDRLFLSDMEELDDCEASGGLFKKGRIWDFKIKLGKRYSPNGIGMHPFTNKAAHASYVLNGQFKTFRSLVGLNDSSGGAATPCTFKVLGDGTLLWKSKPIARPGDMDTCVAKVAGVRVLQLVVECPGAFTNGHMVWIEPQVIK